MKNKIAYAVLTAAMAGGMALGTAGTASAAHCVDYPAHVKAMNGNGAHNEGDHKGFSSCNENSRNYVQP